MFNGGPFDPFGMRRHAHPTVDPFEQMMNEQMSMFGQMNNMMNSMLGSAFSHQPMLGFHQPPQHRAPQPRPSHHDPMAMNLFGGGLGGFGLGGGLMSMMNAAANDPNSMMISQSTMISMNPDGTQRVVTNSTRKAGDVQETRSALRDGDDERVSVGHHIGDRTHYIEKKRDKNGEFRQRQRFVNMDESDAQDFDSEFKSRANRHMGDLFGGNAFNDGRRAIEGGSGRHRSSRRREEPSSSSAVAGSSQPIVTVPDDDDEEVQYVGTTRGGGPQIRELSEDEAEAEQRSKRRRGTFGFFRGHE